jgi:DNA-binding NarL/FixJ family response regulator
MDVRVLIVAGDPLVRAGLTALLGAQPRLAVAGAAAADDDLEAAIAVFRPEVILWDLGLSLDWDPAGAAEQMGALLEGGEDRRVVALLPADAPGRAAWTAGARGLLSREAGAERIAAAVIAVAQGLVAIEPGLAGGLIAEAGPPAVRAEPLIEPLTARELEVLRLLSEGLPNKTIAQRLNISEHTVKFHVNAILGKLGVESRTEAVVRAMRLGLIFL